MEANQAPPLFARQPVFTAGLGVYGHELLYRRALDSTRAVIPDLDAATLTVVAGACQWQPGDLAGEQKILVNFGRGTLLDKAPLALPAGRTVVEVEEGLEPDTSLYSALEAIKAEGYLLALDDFQARPEASRLLDLAGMVIIDVLGRSDDELRVLLDPVLSRGIAALAKKVEDAAAFARCKSLGFSLFQGYFFQRPEMVPGRPLASGELVRLQLLRLTQAPEPDEEALGRIIRSDVSLSYRLLAYLNSPLLEQRLPALSVQRAVMVLGWTRLRHWLRVIALTDLAPSGRAVELSFQSLARARFLELAAQGRGLDLRECENLFTLGLFSLLDAILETPMSALAGGLPLEQAVREALLGGQEGYGRWLAMARSLEQGDWEELEKILESLNVPAQLVAESHRAALEFAAAITRGDG